MKRVLIILTIVLTLGVFVWETFFDSFEPVIVRNDYGEGKKTETYEVIVDGEKNEIQLEVSEKEYTSQEVERLFQKVEKELDQIILGENQSFDRVEQDLNLVTHMEDYPVEIQWELSSYKVLGLDGTILTEDLDKKGTLVELRGTIFYKEKSMVYIRNVMVYPLTRTGTEKLLYDVETELKKVEKSTREKGKFSLPQKVGNYQLTWQKAKEIHWPYILIGGFGLVAYLVYREREKERKKEKDRKTRFLREYPNVISKLTMLLSTGITAKNAWTRIVQNYEEQKENLGENQVYEEMKITLREMQSGVSEAEAYERFGQRCEVANYRKLGTMLSQNLRKGSSGILDILRMEAIQSFENRKSMARRQGEEVGTKLLLPMIGMLGVVLVMVLVPAFLTMQI